MAREWYHYPDGVETEWPEGELPSADSVYQAQFLNQFVKWGNYLHDVGGSKTIHPWPARRTVKVRKGDAVQFASFWNSLCFWPGDAYLLQSRYVFSVAYEILNFKLNIYQALLPQVPLIEPGQDIHPRFASDCFIRNHCIKLRQRLDRCQSVLADSWIWSGGGVSAQGKYATYLKTNDGYSTRTGDSDSTNLFWYSAGVPQNPGGRECRNIWLVDLTITDSRAGAAVVSWYDPAIQNPSNQRLLPVPWPMPTNNTSGFVVAKNASGDLSSGWVALPGDFGKASAPVFQEDRFPGYTTSGRLEVILFPLDTLPPQYG
jgi:hypothetical protein